MKLKIIKVLAFALLMSLSHSAFAVYIPSDTFIEDNADADVECPLTCHAHLLRWTGSWWITADPVSVCECFHSVPWP